MTVEFVFAPEVSRRYRKVPYAYPSTDSALTPERIAPADDATAEEVFRLILRAARNGRGVEFAD